MLEVNSKESCYFWKFCPLAKILNLLRCGFQDQINEGLLVLSDKKSPVISETKKVVVKQVLDPRAGDWLEPDLAQRRGLLDTDKGTYRYQSCVLILQLTVCSLVAFCKTERSLNSFY